MKTPPGLDIIYLGMNHSIRKGGLRKKKIRSSPEPELSEDEEQ